MRIRIAAATTVLVVGLWVPALAHALCAQIYVDGDADPYYGAVWGQTDIWFEASNEIEWGVSCGMAMYYLGGSAEYTAETQVQGPLTSASNWGGPSQWWAHAAAQLWIQQGGFGEYDVSGSGTEDLCLNDYGCIYSSYVHGDVHVSVAYPDIEIFASDDAPYLNSGPVQVWAQLDPSWASPEPILWGGCQPDGSNAFCWFEPSALGPHTVSAWYPGGGFDQVVINVQATPAPTATIEVIALGFTGDLQLARWPLATDLIDPDGETPTWVKSAPSTSDAVAYPYETAPTAFVQVAVSPPLTTSVTVSVRVKNGQTVIATKSGVQLSGSGGAVTGITLNGPLETGAVMRDYTWQWEVSFDGQSWEPIGSTGPQRIYWTLAAPVAPVFVGQFHSPSTPVEYPALFDEVLRYAGTWLGSTPQTSASAIADILTEGIAFDITYNPARNVDEHPFWLTTPSHATLGGHCGNHALLLAGLLRTMGINATTQYVRGGTTIGGVPQWWRYRWLEDAGYTLRVTRPRTDKAPKNAHFKYHAVVTLAGGGLFRDPSYGDVYTLATSTFDETIANPATGTFASGEAAKSNLVFQTIFSQGLTPVDVAEVCLHHPDAEFVAQAVPSTVTAGLPFMVTLYMRNTGGAEATWTAESPVPPEPPDYGLVSWNPPGSSTWGPSYLSNGVTTAPGAVVGFHFTVTAPSTPGLYDFQWRMFLGTEGLPPEWLVVPFGEPSDNVVITVE